MNFKEEIGQRQQYINQVIGRYLPEEKGYQKTIFEALNYSLLAGGKRIRPLLMMETFKMFGGEGKAIEPFMAAMEMIHTYSLVHDDLPAMDNDEYRRGKKTTHAQYGEAMGILAGDALLNYAFETAFTAFDIEGADPYRVAAALKILARKAGIYGMIGGQVVDVESCGIGLSKEQLDFIYELKTACMIESSMMIGGILAGADEKETALLEKIGSDIGIAFQIKDDILDVTGTTEEIGKPAHSDEKNEKTTYITLEGIENATAEAERLSDEAIHLYHELGRSNEFLEELIMWLLERKN